MKATSFTLLTLLLVSSCTQKPSSATVARSHKLASQSAAALNAKDYEQAESLAAQATIIDPEFAEAWVGYGMASVRLGQTDLARDAYERALALYKAGHRSCPFDANQVLQQVIVLTFLERSYEAEALLRQAQIEYPKDKQISKLAENYNETKQGLTSWSVGPK